MKSWILLPIALFFSIQAFAVILPEDESYLLTPKQFESLTQAEQKTYIKKLREIFVAMNENNPHVAAEFAQRASLFASFLNAGFPMALAQNVNQKDATIPVNISFDNFNAYTKTVAEKDISNISADDKRVLEAQFEMSVKYLEAASYFTNNNNTQKPADTFRDNVNKNKMPAAIAALEDNYAKIKKISPNSPALKEWDSGKKRLAKGELPEDHETFINKLTEHGETLMIPTADVKPASVAKKDADPAVPIAAPKVVKAPKAPKAQKENTTAAVIPAPPEIGKTDKKSDGRTPMLYRCMYAGFIVQGEKCEAPRELPWMIDGLNGTQKPNGFIPKPFACAEGSVMCNPLVFGAAVTCDWKKAVEKDRVDSACLATAKPYCVKPNAFATRDCAKLSNNDTALELAVYIMKKSTNNTKAVAAFNESFKELCNDKMIDYNRSANKESTRKDIERTCKVARDQLVQIKKKYSLQKEAYDKAVPDRPRTRH